MEKSSAEKFYDELEESRKEFYKKLEENKTNEKIN